MLRTVVLVATMATVVGGCSGKDSPAPAELSSSRPASSTAASSAAPVAACGAGVLKTMPLRRKLAQLLVVGVTGADDARAVVRDQGIGGIFIGSWTDMSMLGAPLKSIAAQSTVPLTVTVDQEGGRVNRLTELGIVTPSPRTLAKTRTPEQVRTIAHDMGQKMKALGITVDFAPDSDVSDEPDDEVIGDRSFSDDPATVTKYSSAFAQGLRDAGIMPVFKHFPGHGHGSGDSHTGTVRTPPLSSLIADDLVPYKTLIGPDSGSPAAPDWAAVMVGHLIVPGLTGPETPASISPAAMRLLRNGTGYGGRPFGGPIFTDDLSGMAAISAQHPITEAVPMAIEAGADQALWLSTSRVPAVLDALMAAVSSGKLPQAQVDASVVRVLRAKGAITCSR